MVSLINVEYAVICANWFESLCKARFCLGIEDTMICERKQLQVKGSSRGQIKDEAHLGYCSDPNRR